MPKFPLLVGILVEFIGIFTKIPTKNRNFGKIKKRGEL